MTQWIQATLPVRNAVIVEGKTGEWVKAEFDTDAIGELFVQMIVSELPENEDFVSRMRDKP